MSKRQGLMGVRAVVNPLAFTFDKDKPVPDKEGTRAQRRAWQKKYGKKVGKDMEDK